MGATLNGRKKYVLHYMTLRTYIRLGMTLLKIRRVLAFTQSHFLKNYIDQCTSLRQNAHTDFGKRLFKLFSNSVFGKFIEQTRNYMTVKFCTNGEKVISHMSNPNFQNFKIISKNLVAFFEKNKSVKLNKAFPIGFTILDRSKEYMFSQFYEIVKPKFNHCHVVMSDTDSLCLSVKEKKTVNPLSKLKDNIDFSNYPPHHPLYSKINANKLGFWKNELQGCKMKQFVGLRSKMYAYTLDKEKLVHSKCKGITKAYRKTIRFATFRKCVENITKKKIVQYRIQSKNHIVHTLKMNKTAFTSFDDKRYLFNCGVHSVPYGSKYIKPSGDCIFCRKNYFSKVI